MRRIAFAWFLISSWCAQTHAAKNVILFVGDGMGQGVVTATRVKYVGASGKLRLDAFPYTAVVKTYSSDSIVTDSAAAATAFGCGVKTVNDVLGQDATAIYDKKDGRPLQSIAEIAKAMGKAVGIATTTEITHATPAGFYAKINSRDKAKEIAGQLLKTDFDLFLGGGAKFFDLDPIRKDASITLVSNRAELAAAQPIKGKKVLGLFADSHLSYELTRSTESLEPSIADLTLQSLRLLEKSPKGFFLMVEGGKIDHALHKNMTPEALFETKKFDEAVGAAIDHLAQTGKLKDTLILVTADHETGGLSLNGYPPHGTDILQYPNLTYASGPGAGAQPPSALLNPKDGYAYHTGIDVTLFAMGAGAEAVHGTIENTDIFKIMRASFGR